MKWLKRKKRDKPKYFMYVEDGSINVEKVQDELDWRMKNKVMIIVYRQGACQPQLVKIKDNRRINK